MTDLRGKYEGWLRLRLIDGLTRQRFSQLLRLYPTPEAAIGAGVERLMREAELAEPLAAAICAGPRAEDLEAEFEAIERAGARLCCLNDAEYPVNLKNSSSPPPLLYYLGTLETEDRYAIAVVGTRRFSQYGRLTCEKICRELAEAGIVIVSGLARGIDAIAHAAALEEDARTLAVLGNGLAQCYPAEHAGLLERIAAGGAAISQYPMQTSPERYNFPERNRTIAALCLGVVIVEAPLKSGSLITAAHALEENREVFAVPGDISRKNSAGCNQLIRQGARLITCGEDVLEELRLLLQDLLGAARRRKKDLSIETLDELECLVYKLVAEEPIQIDALLQRLSEDYPNKTFDVGIISTLLFQLELKNLVAQLPGQIYAAV